MTEPTPTPFAALSLWQQHVAAAAAAMASSKSEDGKTSKPLDLSKEEVVSLAGSSSEEGGDDATAKPVEILRPIGVKPPAVPAGLLHNLPAPMLQFPPPPPPHQSLLNPNASSELKHRLTSFLQRHYVSSQERLAQQLHHLNTLSLSRQASSLLSKVRTSSKKAKLQSSLS